MLTIKPQTLERVAAQRGWLHQSGRLRGTVNVAAMAKAIGMDRSTVMRAYEHGTVGTELLEKLHIATGLSFDALISVIPEKRSAA